MAAKKTAKKAAKSADPSVAKPAKKAAAKKTAAKPAKAKKESPPSPDVVARAAYLNYRRRVEQGLPGDSHGDWLYAERQLTEEP